MTSEFAFSRPVRVDALPKDGLQQNIEANAAELAALAKLNNLPGIARLSANLRLTRAGRGAVRVRGEVQAEVTQTCVVTLEPIDAVVREEVDVRFAPAEEGRGRDPTHGAGKDELIELSGDEPPDMIEDGRIDLGALAAEFLALGLDPYPRKPGAALEAKGIEISAEDEES